MMPASETSGIPVENSKSWPTSLFVSVVSDDFCDLISFFKKIIYYGYKFYNAACHMLYI